MNTATTATNTTTNNTDCIGKAPRHLTTRYSWYLPHQAWLQANGYRYHDPDGAAPDRADLRGADLWGADLREAELCGANLRETDLRRADLRSANLHRAELDRANVRGAKLQNANLRGWQTSGADLRGVELRGATTGTAGAAPEAAYQPSEVPPTEDHALYVQRERRVEVVVGGERGHMLHVTPLGWSPVGPHPEGYGNIKDGALWDLADEDAEHDVGGLFCFADDLTVDDDPVCLSSGELVDAGRAALGRLFWYDASRRRIVGRVDEIEIDME